MRGNKQSSSNSSMSSREGSKVHHYQIHPPTSCKQTSKAQAVSLLYKTQICKHFMQTGHCAKGEACHFAHGDSELRRKEDVSNSRE